MFKSHPTNKNKGVKEDMQCQSARQKTNSTKITANEISWRIKEKKQSQSFKILAADLPRWTTYTWRLVSSHFSWMLEFIWSRPTIHLGYLSLYCKSPRILISVHNMPTFCHKPFMSPADALRLLFNVSGWRAKVPHMAYPAGLCWVIN